MDWFLKEKTIASNLSKMHSVIKCKLLKSRIVVKDLQQGSYVTFEELLGITSFDRFDKEFV